MAVIQPASLFVNPHSGIMVGSSAGQKKAPIWTSTCAAHTTATRRPPDKLRAGMCFFFVLCRGRESLLHFSAQSLGKLAEILDIVVRPLPSWACPPGGAAGEHGGAVAHPKQQGALRPVAILVHFAPRMHHERSGHDVDGALGRAHLSAAFETEIDFGRLRVTVIRTHLARLPAGDRHIAP